MPFPLSLPLHPTVCRRRHRRGGPARSRRHGQKRCQPAAGKPRPRRPAGKKRQLGADLGSYSDCIEPGYPVHPTILKADDSANPARKRQASISRINAKLFIDPVCPFGYSASPALRAIEWRYRDQISWEMVLIGLTSPDGPSLPYTPPELAANMVPIRDRYGMPFALEPKQRSFTSARACQALVSVRIAQPGYEWKALRALQILFFNTPLLPDDDGQLIAALDTVPGLDGAAAVQAIDSPEVQEGYLVDWKEARTAGGGAGELQGKTADQGEGVRYTAPSVIFSRGEHRMEAVGFQPLEAYDVVVANLAPDMTRCEPAGGPMEALALYPGGLTTREIATVISPGDPVAASEDTEQQLIRLVGDGAVDRIPLGDDALWVARP